MKEISSFRWDDGSELVRFLDEHREAWWIERVKKDLRSSLKKSGRPDFEFPDHHRYLFLMGPEGGEDRCRAVLAVMLDGSELFVVQRIFPHHSEGTPPNLTRKLWGIYRTLSVLPVVPARSAGPRGDGILIDFDLPWEQPTRSKHGYDYWPATKCFYDKIQYDACDDYHTGTFGHEVNEAKRIRGFQIRIRQEPFWEVSRRPRPSNLPGPSEHIWSASNFSLDLHVHGETDLDGALIKAGIVFWRLDGPFGRDAFVASHAEMPMVRNDEEVNLLLGVTPPSFRLSTKELREYVMEDE